MQNLIYPFIVHTLQVNQPMATVHTTATTTLLTVHNTESVNDVAASTGVVYIVSRLLPIMDQQCTIPH